MYNVAICSCLRAGSEYETAYYTQILGLSRTGLRIASVNVVYDRDPESSRWLRDLLQSQGIPVRYEIEGQSGDVAFQNLAEKARQWASVGNQYIDLALSTDDGLTHIAIIESDLCYPYDTLQVLLQKQKAIIAPLIYLNNVFYDTWGFRNENNERITALPPVLPISSCQPVELSSVGSFILLEVSVFRAGVRFRGDYENGLIAGVCQDAGRLGFKTFMDPSISILHPVTAWRQQCWQIDTFVVSVHGVPVLSKTKMNDVFVAGPFDEVVRPWIDLQLGNRFDASCRRSYTIRRHDGTKRLDAMLDITRVDVEHALPPVSAVA